MTRLNVNPTRMERTRQKTREKTARRGHKLLKDKSDEMLRTFMRLIKQNRALREQVDGELTRALQFFVTARIHMTSQEIENAVSSCAKSYSLETGTQNIMGLVVPKLGISDTEENTDTQCRFLTTHPSFDKSIQQLSSLMTKLAELASIEKTCSMLACEIERSRRRINALEYSIIPQIDETIRYITMKLAENELGNQVRLMKVKQMLSSE